MLSLPVVQYNLLLLGPSHTEVIALQIPAAVNIELRQQLEDMGFSANR